MEDIVRLKINASIVIVRTKLNKMIFFDNDIFEI